MTNTERATFAVIAFVILVGMMFSDEPSLILYLPVLGLGFAAATGKCLLEKPVAMALDYLNIPQ